MKKYVIPLLAILFLLSGGCGAAQKDFSYSTEAEKAASGSMAVFTACIRSQCLKGVVYTFMQESTESEEAVQREELIKDKESVEVLSGDTAPSEESVSTLLDEAVPSEEIQVESVASQTAETKAKMGSEGLPIPETAASQEAGTSNCEVLSGKGDEGELFIIP